MSFVESVCQPSTLRMLIWPEASNAQNSMAAVSADGSTVCVLILRLNSSCSRSIALVVRTLRHWLGGSRVKVNRRSPTYTQGIRNGLKPVALWRSPSMFPMPNGGRCDLDPFGEIYGSH